jgi:hypothetical protein
MSPRLDVATYPDQVRLETTYFDACDRFTRLRLETRLLTLLEPQTQVWNGATVRLKRESHSEGKQTLLSAFFEITSREAY